MAIIPQRKQNEVPQPQWTWLLELDLGVRWLHPGQGFERLLIHFRTSWIVVALSLAVSGSIIFSRRNRRDGLGRMASVQRKGFLQFVQNMSTRCGEKNEKKP